MYFRTLLTFSSVLTATLASGTVSAELLLSNDLIFLGKSSPKFGIQQGIQRNSFYFISQNAAAWSTAANDCRAFLGDTATLVNIETEKELGEITNFLRNSDDTGTSYWTGGTYDIDLATFVWSSGKEIASWAPWDQGEPNTRTSVTRVFAHTVGAELKLRTDFTTTSLRYVCELYSEGTAKAAGASTTTAAGAEQTT